MHTKSFLALAWQLVRVGEIKLIMGLIMIVSEHCDFDM